MFFNNADNAAFWSFQVTGERGLAVQVSSTSEPGTMGVTVSGFAPGGAALVEAVRQRAALRSEAVGAARELCRRELAALTRARAVAAEAAGEDRASGEALEAAKVAHRDAIASARNPAQTRAALQAAEQRRADSAQWSKSAAQKLVAAEGAAQNALTSAWSAVRRARQQEAERAGAEAAKALAALLPALVEAALPAGAPVMAFQGDAMGELLADWSDDEAEGAPRQLRIANAG